MILITVKGYLPDSDLYRYYIQFIYGMSGIIDPIPNFKAESPGDILVMTRIEDVPYA